MTFLAPSPARLALPVSVSRCVEKERNPMVISDVMGAAGILLRRVPRPIRRWRRAEDDRPRRGRHRAARRGVGSVPVTKHAVFSVTDAHTGCEHLVTEDAIGVGRRSGRYAGVCGADVLAASLTAPGRGYCRSCAGWVGVR